MGSACLGIWNVLGGGFSPLWLQCTSVQMQNLLKGESFPTPMCLLSFIHLFRVIVSKPLIVCILDWRPWWNLSFASVPLCSLRAWIFLQQMSALACPFLPVCQPGPLALRQLFHSSSFYRNPHFSFREKMLAAWKLLSQPLNLSLEAAPTHPAENLNHPSDVACYVYVLWLHLKQFIFVLTKRKCEEFTDKFKQRGGIWVSFFSHRWFYMVN